MLNLKELEKTEFFSFFDLHITENIPETSGLTRVMLKTGGFQEHVDITIKIDKSQSVHEAYLDLDRSFIGDELSLNPFAKDICKSFIAQMCSNIKSEMIDDLVDGLWQVTGKNNRVIYIEAPPPLEERKSQTKEAIKVYIGLKNSFELKTNKLKLNLANMDIEGKERLHVTINYTSINTTF